MRSSDSHPTSLRRAWTAACLLALNLPTVASAQVPATAFTQPFDYTKTKIVISPASKWGVFKTGDSVTISTSNSLTITVFNSYGQTVYSGAPTTTTYPAGHYFVQCNGDRNQFVVLPADYDGAPFFGAWTARTSTNDYLQPIYSQLGMQWVRTSWGAIDNVRSDASAWNWTNMDAVVAANPGRAIIVTAADGPALSWIQSSQLLSVYTNFVSALAQRYKGKLAAIEIWNEPSQNKLYNDLNWLETLAQLTIQGTTAIHAVDPSIQVMAPVWNWSANYNGSATLTQLGAAPFVDTLTWHDYESYNYPPDQDVSGGFSNVLTRIALYRQAAQFSGPLAVTEMGLWGDSALGMSYGWAQTNWPAPPTWDVAMERTIKQTVMYRAGGAEVLIPQDFATSCAFGLGWDSSLGGWEYGNRGPAPKTSGFLMTCYWLDGAQLIDYRTLGRSIFLFAWQRPNNTSIVFAWTLEGQSVALSSISGLNPTDLFGATISPSALASMPILFQSNSANASGLLSNVMSRLPDTNLPPIIDPVSNQTVLKGQTLQFTVPASDPDNDPITFSAASLPNGATIDPSTGVFSWTPNVTQAGSYPINFTVTDARGMSASTSTIINVIGSPLDGLVHEWKLDDGSGTIASDSAGTNDGILVNFNPTTDWVTGSIGTGLSFTGTNSYVNLGTSPINLTNNFTVSAWVYPRDTAGGEVFMAARFQYGLSGLRLIISGNQLTVEGTATTGLIVQSFALDQIQNDTWYHVVIVYDKSTLNVYLDGVYQPETYGGNQFWGGDLVMNPSASSSLGFWSGDFFNGILSDVRIYSRTLTGPEVLALYQSADLPLSLAPIGNKSVTVGQTLNFTISASVSDDTNLTYSAASLPTGATFDPAMRTFNWTPAANQVGTYDVTFTVTDGTASNSQMATITVSKSAGQLILKPIKAKRVRAGHKVKIKLSAKGPKHVQLTYSIAPMPAGSTLDPLRGKFTWVTTGATVGTYSLTAGVTDGTNTDTEPVSITLY